jgi:hypothetical protein
VIESIRARRPQTEIMQLMGAALPAKLTYD